VATPDAIELATKIMAAFVANNAVPRADLPALFEGLHSALKRLAGGGEVAPADIEKPAPAVSIRKSVTPDYLICLDDGKRFKSLRRHLATLGMTTEQYRAKWNLPSTYPMGRTQLHGATIGISEEHRVWAAREAHRRPAGERSRD
jgi:predicted transcriptional regulator